ncbi:MAG: type II toxin-antitoxin system HicB family antitoxin [Solirubrobacterales bacterium]
MSEYAVIIEQGEQGFGAYVPDLPGCVATATTREEVTRLIGEAIELHIADLQRRGEAVPPPRSSATRVEVSA